MSEKKTEALVTTNYSKFTLIDLLTILLLVGLLFVFIVPVNQAKVSRDRVDQAVTTMRFIGDKASEFKSNPDNGYYPDLSQLNLGDKVKSPYFTYIVSPDDSTVVGETTPAFGKKGAFLVYNISTKQFQIGKGDNDIESARYINENWLP
jgi:competence protein ComGC